MTKLVLRASLVAWIVVMAGVGACGGSESTTPDAADASVRVCAPGQSIACVGAAGCSGGQACNAEGTGYERCLCAQGSDAGDATVVDAAPDGSMDAAPNDSAPPDASIDSGRDADATTDGPQEAASDATTDGPQEAASDAEGGTVTRHAKIILVHASPNAPDFRFCIAVGRMNDGSDLAVPPIPALPHDDSNLPAGRNYPALYAGGGGALPDLTDLQPLAVTLFAIPMPNATIASDVSSNPLERTCDTLIGATGSGGVLARNTGFFQMSTIPSGTFLQSNTYVLALTGCTQGNTSTDAQLECGSSYSASTGNFGVRIVQLDRTVADGTKLGLQVLHLAQPLDGYIGAQFAGGMKNFVGLTPDNGPQVNPPVGNGINYGAFVPEGGVAAPEIFAATDYPHEVAYDRIVGYADGGQAYAKTIALPFTVVQLLSYGSVDAGNGIGPNGLPLYLPGANFTLILIGDPTAQQLVADGGFNPLYDGHGVHFLMFPNDPPLPRL